LLLPTPLEAAQSYALITGSSPAEVLQHFLIIRLTSIQSSLTKTVDSRSILHVIHSIKSTVIIVNALFPFTFQRAINELKSISLLNHQDLYANLERRKGNSRLWIQADIKKFLIWTKSDLLDNTGVDQLVDKWMSDVYKLLTENVRILFSEIRELDSLCTLRAEIIQTFIDEDQATNSLEPVCRVFLTEIATQMTKSMATRVGEIHRLETAAKALITMVKGFQRLHDEFTDVVDDDTLSIWESTVPGQVKLERILSLKCAQERPDLKGFTSQYTLIMREIDSGEVILSQLLDTSEYMKDELVGVLATHQEHMSSEFESCSSSFKALLDNIVTQHDTFDNLTGLYPKLHADHSRSSHLLAPITFYYHQPTPDNAKIIVRALFCSGCKN
jgi:hypothetical protein